MTPHNASSGVVKPPPSPQPPTACIHHNYPFLTFSSEPPEPAAGSAALRAPSGRRTGGANRRPQRLGLPQLRQVQAGAAPHGADNLPLAASPPCLLHKTPLTAEEYARRRPADAGKDVANC